MKPSSQQLQSVFSLPERGALWVLTAKQSAMKMMVQYLTDTRRVPVISTYYFYFSPLFPKLLLTDMYLYLHFSGHVS